MKTKNNDINSLNSFSEKSLDLINYSNDKTFNKLRDLQSLIKKESALKELCKK